MMPPANAENRAAPPESQVHLSVEFPSRYPGTDFCQAGLPLKLDGPRSWWAGHCPLGHRPQLPRDAAGVPQQGQIPPTPRH